MEKHENKTFSWKNVEYVQLLSSLFLIMIVTVNFYLLLLLSLLITGGFIEQKTQYNNTNFHNDFLFLQTIKPKICS